MIKCFENLILFKVERVIMNEEKNYVENEMAEETLTIEGTINSLEYLENKNKEKKEGFFQRLFK